MPSYRDLAGIWQAFGRDLEPILINAKNHNMATSRTRWRARRWALKVAIFALAIQILMPITQGVAASNVVSGAVSGNVLALCTQFGIQFKSIGPDGTPINPLATKTPWDCPICQLQIGADTPRAQIFVLKKGGLEKNNIEPASNSVVVGISHKDPNSPRAPPAV